MAGIGSDAIWRLRDAISGAIGKSGASQTVRARVAEVTPTGVSVITSSGSKVEITEPLAQSVSPGDVVDVEVRGGNAGIVSNSTDPSASTGMVEAVSKVARDAEEGATLAQFLARTAKATVGRLTQYFWHDDDGAHVISSLDQNSVRYRQDMRGQGTEFTEIAADGTESVVASIGPRVRLGREGESNVTIDYHSMELVDRSDNPYFRVEDLLNEEGYASITDRYTVKEGDGWQFEVRLSYPPTSTTLDSVTLGGEEITNYQVYRISSTYYVRFVYEQTESAPPVGAVIVMSYRTTSTVAKSLTFGSRAAGSNLGAYSSSFGRNNIASGERSHAEGYSSAASGQESHAEGSNCTASGDRAHAEGYNATASGDHSHAEGFVTVASGEASHAQGYGTVAASDEQTVIGLYNVIDSNGKYVLIIGNGTGQGASERSNALAVDWDGNMELAGLLKPTAATDEWTLASGVSSASVHACRANGVALTIAGENVTLAASLASGSQVVLGTAPEGFRPPVRMQVAAMSYQGNVDNAIVQVATDGTITLTNRGSSAIATSNRIVFGMTVAL